VGGVVMIKAPKKLIVGLPLTVDEYRLLKRVLELYRDVFAEIEEEKIINSILERIDLVLKCVGDC